MTDEDEQSGHYDDTFTWSRRQARALRRRDLDAIDWERVIREIEDIGDAGRTDWVSWRRVDNPAAADRAAAGCLGCLGCPGCPLWSIVLQQRLKRRAPALRLRGETNGIQRR